MEKLLILITTIWLFSSPSYAQPPLADTPQAYYGNLINEEVSGVELKHRLFRILTSYHIAHPGDADEIKEHCTNQDQRCYRFQKLGYKEVRKHLFGKLDLEEGEDGYEITTIYCRKKLTNSDFPGQKNLGPMKIPESTIVNTEHSWPQSKFSHHFSKSLQKTDLHALFASLSKVNSQRANHPFGPVEEEDSSYCAKASLGTNDDSNRKVFEPPAVSKGNIARALFYFSIRYKKKIDPIQEHHLRQWHIQDPVNDAERIRNDGVFSILHTRNPFIDHPELIDQIADF